MIYDNPGNNEFFSAFDPFANASASIQPNQSSDIDSTLSNLVNNMDIKNPSWMNNTTQAQGGWPQAPQQPPAYGANPSQPSQSNPNPFNPFG